MLTRINLIKNSLGAVATFAVVGPSLLTYIWNSLRGKKPKQLTQSEKECIIARALETEEGRHALAQSMVEPIRGPREYQVGRKPT